VFWVRLPERTPPGREQSGRRPCVLIADPATVHPTRYPVVILAPFTGRTLPAAVLYPRLQAGTGGLPTASTVLLDQLVAVDVGRIEGRLGALTPDELEPVRVGLRAMLGL